MNGLSFSDAAYIVEGVNQNIRADSRKRNDFSFAFAFLSR